MKFASLWLTTTSVAVAAGLSGVALIVTREPGAAPSVTIPENTGRVSITPSTVHLPATEPPATHRAPAAGRTPPPVEDDDDPDD
nr:hypothetical protein GCM10017745_28280 [Saccharothrix mutabilis subsp. capreolus]